MKVQPAGRSRSQFSAIALHAVSLPAAHKAQSLWSESISTSYSETHAAEGRACSSSSSNTSTNQPVYVAVCFTLLNKSQSAVLASQFAENDASRCVDLVHLCAPCRVWEAAYEQLQMEKGVCNLVQKYSPEAVREQALSSPASLFQILVSCCVIIKLV